MVRGDKSFWLGGRDIYCELLAFGNSRQAGHGNDTNAEEGGRNQLLARLELRSPNAFCHHK